MTWYCETRWAPVTLGPEVRSDYRREELKETTMRAGSGLMLGVLLLGAALTAARADYVVFERGARPVTADEAARYGWPEAVLRTANHPLRLQGWKPEWGGGPNDSETFGYELRNTGEANDLIRTFSRAGRALFLTASRTFQWELGKGQRFDATFQAGSEKLMDEWMLRSGAKTRPHVSPPMLVLYAGSGKVDPDRLRIPEGTRVSVTITPEDRALNPRLAERLERFGKRHAPVQPEDRAAPRIN
jgi:hypothetical protein